MPSPGVANGGAVAIFTDPIREHADFGPGDAEWLHLLVGDWQLVADLAFADLALWFPHPELGYVALAHVRPSTTHTVFHSDFVGERIRVGPAAAGRQGLGEPDHRALQRNQAGAARWRMRVEAVPMVRNGRTLAVVTSHMDLSSSRMPSRLELTYRQCAYDLLRMGTLGLWPDFASPTGSRRGAPARGGRADPARRRGDRPVRQPQRRLRVPPAGRRSNPWRAAPWRRSPPACSRTGGMVDETLPLVVTGRMPWRSEIESRGVSLSLRAIPLRDEQQRFGALVLCRDVSELRRREHGAGDQGRHHPRDPPPGEEQPADRGGAAAHAVPADGQRRGQAGAGAGHAAGGHHRAGARDAVPGAGPERRLRRTDRPPVPALRRGGLTVAAGPHRARRASSASCPATLPPRWPWSSTNW